MNKIIFLSLVIASALMAGGYKIPELSLNATALSSANVAHSSGADTAYYNPANMVFMKDENTIETDLTYIGLSDTNYHGSYTNNLIVTTSGHYINAKKENFLVPSLHYVSGDISGARFGLSIVAPAGLSKRWNDSPAKTSADEFTLTTIELNPTVALPIADKLAVAIGIRVIYSDGVVKSDGPLAIAGGPVYSTITRDMTGDSIDFGYNLALAYKPTSELELGLTYRSKIDLKLEGKATLTSAADFATYSGGTSVSIPVPAALNVAIAYTFPTDTIVEFVYERTFWSQYKELDFNYDGALGSAILTAAFDDAKAKNWKDTNSYRLGITQELDELTLMCGIVIDETPIPESTLSFELPDSDSVSISFGGRYQINEKLNLGLSTLYSIREDRTVSNDSLTGEFTDTSALLISAGLEYKF
ncbi:MAG: outer membrane protein transport protein [Sulfurimonas sp.]|nr:outer membrane protein transport protein [Sulfurimonas sp.]